MRIRERRRDRLPLHFPVLAWTLLFLGGSAAEALIGDRGHSITHTSGLADIILELLPAIG